MVKTNQEYNTGKHNPRISALGKISQEYNTCKNRKRIQHW
jgi:hypothetical protein